MLFSFGKARTVEATPMLPAPMATRDTRPKRSWMDVCVWGGGGGIKTVVGEGLISGGEGDGHQGPSSLEWTSGGEG